MPQQRRGSARLSTRSGFGGEEEGTAQAQRRRSSASEITLDFSATGLGDKPSMFCPIPKTRKGFFYSTAWKEHKKKRKVKRRQLQDSGDSGGGSSVDDEIPLCRDLTRRKRNSFHKDVGRADGEASNLSPSSRNFLAEPTNVSAYLAARIEAEKPVVEVNQIYNHSVAIQEGRAKSHMMDISLVGKGGVQVRASRFILGCYSTVLEEVFFKRRAWPGYNRVASKLMLDFCCEDVIKAAVHHCFIGELPPDFSISTPSESVARNLAQLDQLAYVYKFSAIGEVTYRALRKLINRRAVLACAIFDELSYRQGVGHVESIKRYALDSMREMPMDTILAGGVQWLKEASLEAIMQDQDMDVDEFYMFKILTAWASGGGEEEDRGTVAKRLAKHIELKFIDPDVLGSQVRKSGYFSDRMIDEAVKLIEDSLANRDPCEMERVIVEGAGTEAVNGIYCRVEEEVGISEEEIIFVKEAEDGFSDVGLYLWGTRWNIAMCADYSNCFYSCEDPPDKSPTELVPREKWTVQYGGADPPPSCTYLPNTRYGRVSFSSQKGLLAPNLEEMMDPTIAQKRRSVYFDKRTEDVVEKRTMTLEQMMNLPEDRREIRDHHD